MNVVDLPVLSQLAGLDVAHRPGGAISLAVGMAHVFANIGEGLRHTMKYWFQFIIMFEALFILTTIDAGTRVARYILQDILGYVYKPLGRKDWIPGVVVTSALVSLAWGYMLYTGDISSIWPMFGATNQNPVGSGAGYRHDNPAENRSEENIRIDYLYPFFADHRHDVRRRFDEYSNLSGQGSNAECLAQRCHTCPGGHHHCR